MKIQEDQKQIDPPINSLIDDNININNYENNNINNISRNNTSIYLDSEIIPIVDQLIEIGYNKIYAKRLVAFYHPRTIDEALNYFLNEGGIIQHFYIEDKELLENKICFLCGERKEIHLGYIPENNNNINDNNLIIKNNINDKDTIDDLIYNINNEDNNNNMNKELISNRNNSINNISFKKEECPICSDYFIPSSENKLETCGHSFCNNCWYNFLSIKIEENKITFIKCLNYECQEKLSDEFIINLLNSNNKLISKYRKYKLELEILNDPNKKFCPYPNCNSYAVLKDIKQKYVKCSKNHNFCFLCLEKPHGKKPCKDTLDKSIINYSKNNFIKKCPHCGIITQKSEGCNHITCSKCSYQWCWLCNEKYNTEHFRQGKCKGYQFFKPKNEEDIKLAFEGKIILNESQRQNDLENEVDNNFNQRRIRNIRNRRIGRGFHNEYERHHIEHHIDIFRIKKYCCNIVKMFLLFFIYLFFGHFILLINPFGECIYNNIHNKSEFYRNILRLLIIPFYFLIIVLYLIPQIVMNLFMILPYIIMDKFFSFIKDFDIIFFDEIIYTFFYIFIYFFEAELFLKLYYFFAQKKNHLKRKIFLISFCFIGFFHIISYIPYYIIIGIINITFKLFSGEDIKNDLENLIKSNFIKYRDI